MVHLPGGHHLRVAKQERTESENGRGWTWAALVAAIVVWAAGLPSFGLSLLLAPLGVLLSLVAWRRSPRDALLWIGLVLNGLLLLGLIGEIVAVLTGEASIGWE